MRFGIMMPVYGGWTGNQQMSDPVSFEYMKQIALRSDKDEYHSLWVPDHLLNPIKGEEQPSLEAWTTLTALAPITQNVKLAHTTLCYAFRYPAVLAKMAATLDDVSNGRFILSMGAGWYEREFKAYGLEFIDHDLRVEATGEALQLIKELWTKSEVTFKGKYFNVEHAILEPKPVQKPRPPIWYAGDSEASQRVAAEHADVWLFSGISPATLAKRIKRFKERYSNQPMDYAMSAVTILDERQDKAVILAKGWFSEKYEEVISSGLIGSPRHVINKIEKYAEIGVSYILLRFPVNTYDSAEKFGKEILPSFS
jgi:FMNH2-dependent dimethyl sulfone monooxygenase